MECVRKERARKCIERESVGVWGGRKLTGDLGWNYGNAIANYYYYLW